MQIATWNVNSIKSRLQHLLEWLKRDAPEIVLLQETKCTDDTFPSMEIEELGYNIAMHGEKSYNGVAILSKFPLEDIKKGLPGGGEDAQTRYIEAVVSWGGSGNRGMGESSQKTLSSSPIPLSPYHPIPLRIASVYVPNGQEPDSDKFRYKLQFLDRLSAHVKTLLAYGEMLAIGGDYNIAPEDDDVHNPQAWANTVLTHFEVRKRLRKIFYAGMYDAFRLISPLPLREGVRGRGGAAFSNEDIALPPTPPSPSRGEGENNYTWWDYRAGGFARDDGLRIDHILLSPQAADQLTHIKVVKELRALEKASDHAPVIVQFTE